MVHLVGQSVSAQRFPTMSSRIDDTVWEFAVGTYGSGPQPTVIGLVHVLPEAFVKRYPSIDAVSFLHEDTLMRLHLRGNA